MSDVAKLSDRQRSAFWSKVDRSGDCWVWTGVVSGSGYGRINVWGVSVYAHRVAHELATGIATPCEMDVDHICHNRRCVRPSHLRPATRSENNENFGRTHAHSTSGIRGVSWHAKSERWRVSVVKAGHQFHGGFYDDIAEAESAVVALRNDLYTHNDMDRTERKSA